jgi:hypothetical protein
MFHQRIAVPRRAFLKTWPLLGDQGTASGSINRELFTACDTTVSLSRKGLGFFSLVIHHGMAELRSDTCICVWGDTKEIGAGNIWHQ